MTKSRSNATAPNAKGTLVVGNGTDASTTLAVASTAGYVLTVDSAEATGLKWAAIPASTPTYAGCLVTQASDQTIANNTEQVITFTSESFDTDGFHSNTTNTSRITIPTGKGGYYSVYGFAAYATNSTGERQLNLAKNGTIFRYTQQQGIANGRTGVFIQSTVSLAAGDYVELLAYQNSGGNLDIGGGTNRFFFGADYIGA